MMHNPNYFSLKIFKVITLLTISILLCLPSFIYGINWYVSTTTSGNGNGSSWANKIALSNFNWSAVSPGDVVYIDGGSSGLTYTTNLIPTKSGTSGNPITITRGVDSGHDGIPTFTTTTYRSGHFSYNYLVIQYLNFTSTGGSGYEVVEIDGDYVTFQYNTILNPRLKAVRLDSGTGCKLLHNIFDTGTSNPSGASPDGIWMGNNGSNLEIAYNQILMRNNDPGNGAHKDNIQTYMWQTNGSTSYGTTKIHHNFLYSASATSNANTTFEISAIGGNWEIYNNVVVYGGQGSGRVIYLGNCDSEGADGILFSAKIYNNTFYIADDSYYGMMFDDTDTLIFKNNIIYNSGGLYNIANLGTTTTSNYMDIDYNQYHSSNASDFLYHWTCLGSANSYSFASWRSTFSQDAHSEYFTSGTSISFVGGGFPIRSLNPLDYRLSTSSSGVNEGTTLTLFSDDYAGVSRPQNGTWDVAAFELSTGGGGNNPPNQPSNPNPVNGATGRPVNLTMTWTCTDPDGNPLTYDIYFGTNNNPPLISSNQSSASYNPGQLSSNTTYYWKIVAKDNQGATTSGPVWNFTTQTVVVNNPPNQPSNPNPVNGATGRPVNLTMTWTCTDPEGDPLTYDVYFGTNSNPPIAATNRTSASYTPAQLNYNTTYYWKIVAKDNQGHSTSGSVWNFTTIYLDTTPPEVINITVTSAKNVTVNFSEKLNPTNAKNKNNYLISNNVIINSVSLLPDSSSVLIKTSIQQRNREYSITMTNISDKSGNYTDPNPNVVSYFLPRRGPGYMIIIPVNKVIANNFDLNFLPEKTIDGNGMESPDSRWQSSTAMPDTLIFDFGSESSLDSLRISFYDWQSNRIYKYSVNCSVDSIKWHSIIKNVWSEENEWTEIEFDSTSARYVELILLESNENTVASIWEIEFYGPDRFYKINNGTESPTSFMLSQNYPNPFNPSTTFKYSIAKQSSVLIRIYDLIGNEIETLVNEEKPAGTYELTWNANNLPSGVYFYQLQAGDFVETKKMILMK